MPSPLIFMVAALLSYALAAAFALISCVRPVSSGNRRELAATVIGSLFLVSALVVHGVQVHHFHICSRFATMTIYCLAISVAYGLMSLRHNLRGIALVVIPFVMLLLVGIAVRAPLQANIDARLPGVWLDVHILTALVGYAMFTLACILAVAYLIQDRNLKRKHLGALFERLPSLETLDHLMAGQIQLAFIIFTVSVGSGVVLTHLNRWSPKWITDPKTIATLVTWLVYAILFYLRMTGSYHGRKVALVTIGGFLCVVFTFIGINLLGQTMHTFPPTEYAGGGP